MTAYIYIALFLSGMASLIYEVSWLRQIGLYFGFTTEANSVILTCFFLGMSIGYWLGSKLSKMLKAAILGYMVCELVIATWSFAVPTLIHQLQSDLLIGLTNHDDLFWRTVFRISATNMILLPVTLSLGATLPFIADHIKNHIRC